MMLTLVPGHAWRSTVRLANGRHQAACTCGWTSPRTTKVKALAALDIHKEAQR